MDEIINDLYVGSFKDGALASGEPSWSVYFVHEQYGQHTPKGATWVPFVRSTVGTDGVFHVTGVNQKMLDGLIEGIDRDLQKGKKVLIHCAEGKERAPLAATCFLHRAGRAKTLKEAFGAVHAKRPRILDRLGWIE